MKLPPYKVKILLFILQALSAIFIIGFVVFVRYILAVSNEMPSSNKYDCLIVFTGGKGRIDAALDIKKKLRINKTLISGVWDGTSLYDIKLINHIKTQHKNIDLGYLATDTIGNAIETDIWARHNRCYNTLILTSDYHLPRSKFLVEILAKNLNYSIIGINNENFKIAKWWDFPGTFKLIFTEYIKIIATYILNIMGFLENL